MIERNHRNVGMFDFFIVSNVRSQQSHAKTPQILGDHLAETAIPNYSRRLPMQLISNEQIPVPMAADDMFVCRGQMSHQAQNQGHSVFGSCVYTLQEVRSPLKRN